jgi:hypothetical protein
MQAMMMGRQQQQPMFGEVTNNLTVMIQISELMGDKGHTEICGFKVVGLDASAALPETATYKAARMQVMKGEVAEWITMLFPCSDGDTIRDDIVGMDYLATISVDDLKQMVVTQREASTIKGLQQWMGEILDDRFQFKSGDVVRKRKDSLIHAVNLQHQAHRFYEQPQAADTKPMVVLWNGEIDRFRHGVSLMQPVQVARYDDGGMIILDMIDRRLLELAEGVDVPVAFKKYCHKAIKKHREQYRSRFMGWVTHNLMSAIAITAIAVLASLLAVGQAHATPMKAPPVEKQHIYLPDEKPEGYSYVECTAKVCFDVYTHEPVDINNVDKDGFYRYTTEEE